MLGWTRYFAWLLPDEFSDDPQARAGGPIFRGAIVFALVVAATAASRAIAQDYATPPDYGRPHPQVTELSGPSAADIRIALQPEQVPAGARQPQPAEPAAVPPQQNAAAPAKGPNVFGPGQVRLPLLDSNGKPLGVTPQPSPQTIQEFRQFVDRTIDPENTLDLIQGRPRLILLKQTPQRIQIADENIANYSIIEGRQLSVTGNSVGSTILNLWFAGPPQGPPSILSYLVRVFPDPEQKERLERVYKALEAEINHTFPNSVVHLALVGDKLVLSGDAKDVVEATQILRVVAANAPGNTRGRNGFESDEIPVGQINVVAPASFQQPVGAGGAQAAQLPEQTLQNFLLRNQARNVINLLRVPGEQQVMLRVTVAEVDRTAARSIGMDFTIANKAGTTVFAQATNAVANTMGGAGNLPTLLDNGQVALAIRALRSLNLARSMAEPNLVTVNGQAAQFRAGGEFPVPSATQSFGGVGQGVAFVPFGVSLNFLPIITDHDRVRLQVSADVSTLDPSLGTNIGGAAISGGTSVPGLQTRTFQTNVELRGGQTLAVAGLIQNNYGASANRVPLFGDLPIVGNLFGRNDTTSGDQELVILITPELVHPLEKCHTPPLPGADVFEPGDIEFYVLGHLEGRRSEDFRSQTRTDYARMRSYERCEDELFIGPKGHTFNCCPSDGDAGCCPVADPASDAAH